MEDLPLTAQKESEGIETSVLIIALASLCRKLVEQGGLDESEASEVEIVANAAQMVVDDWVVLAHTIDHVVMVGIDHRSIRVGSHTKHALEGTLSHLQLSRLGLQQHIICFGILGNTHQRVTAREVAHDDLMAVGEVGSLLIGEVLADEQEYVLDCLAESQLPDGIQGSLEIVARQKTINFFSHEVILLVL